MILRYFKRCALIALLIAFSITPALAGPLHEAAEEGDIAQVKRLLSEGADIHAKNKDGETALHLATSWGQTSMVKLLLARGADVHARDKTGKTVLYYAKKKGYKAIILLLQKHGAK